MENKIQETFVPKIDRKTLTKKKIQERVTNTEGQILVNYETWYWYGPI
jgi:hypothetical protein